MEARRDACVRRLSGRAVTACGEVKTERVTKSREQLQVVAGAASAIEQSKAGRPPEARSRSGVTCAISHETRNDAVRRQPSCAASDPSVRILVL